MKIYIYKETEYTYVSSRRNDTNSAIMLRHLLNGGGVFGGFHTMDIEEVKILAKMHGCELIVVDN